MNKKIIGVVLGIVVIGGGSFYAGTKYTAGENISAREGSGNFANLSPEERQARLQQVGNVGFSGAGRGMRIDGGFVAGEIIAKDDKSITVKLRDGGSKIVFLTNATPITKSANGSINDLQIGGQVTISGAVNQDGSVNAQSVQIR